MAFCRISWKKQEKKLTKPKVVALVQARLGSSRLPAKSLLNLHGLPVIDWIGRRVSRAKLLDSLVFALPDTELDEVLARHLGNQGYKVYRGSENDVLSRFNGAAKMSDADYIVRICADNPLIWWTAIDELIDFYFEQGPDYAYNHIPKNNSWPDGLGAEMIAADLLAELDCKATSPLQREHCLNYIWENADQFKIATFNPAEDWLRHPELKLDLDTIQDFKKLSLLDIDPDIDGLTMIRACQGCVRV